LPILLVLGLGLLLRLYHLNAPIIGVHAWRQSDTAAMARNYYENGFRFLYPQVDWGGSGPGYAETEFPLYPYAVSLIYKLLGVSEAYGRLLSALCFVGAIYFLYRLVALLADRSVALWSAFFFAISPLTVFYGRTVQPEAMVMLACTIALYGFAHWLRHRQDAYLALSAAGLALAALLKLLPLVYVGLPLLWLAGGEFRGRLWRQGRLWLYAAAVLGATAAWYLHAHSLYQATGLTFGFWGGATGRYDWLDLLTLGFWGDIALRLVVRYLAVFGLVLFLVGVVKRPRSDLDRLLLVGMGSVALSWAIAPTSSYIHEYYQLPFMLYAAPALGQGWVSLTQRPSRLARRLAYGCLALMAAAGLAIYSLDYLARENVQTSAAYALAQQVQAATPPTARIITVTGSDPNLLYLAYRKGWMLPPERVETELLQALAADGAEYLVGSYQVIESFNPFVDEGQKARLKTLIETNLEPVVHTEALYIARLPWALVPPPG
jgi:4-amino-4-deoxy-L-arabinose transferase-like glycosyltransferase